MFYNGERSNTTSNASLYDTTSVGKVALPYFSDALLATDGNNGASLKSTCISTAVYADSGYAGVWLPRTGNCYAGSWIIMSSSINSTWTLSSSLDDKTINGIENRSGSNGTIWINPAGSVAYIYPSVYLKANVKVLNDGNDGSQAHPYNLTI